MPEDFSSNGLSQGHHQFDASGNFCAQRPESLLKDAAKKPGRRAQKRHTGVNFELQYAQRLAQSFVIDTVHSRFWQSGALTTPAIRLLMPMQRLLRVLEKAPVV